MLPYVAGLHLGDATNVALDKTVHMSSMMDGYNMQALVDDLPGNNCYLIMLLWK